MDYNAIATFVMVAETGSFTRAAERLGMQKSKVSRQIAALERALAVRLVERTTQRLHLTEAGIAFYDRCRHALAEITSARDQATEIVEVPRGEIALTAPVDLGAWLSETVLPDFLRNYPLINVRLSLSNQYQDLLEYGFNAALRIGHHADAAYVSVPVTTFERALFASPDYLARRGSPREPEDLVQHDCLRFSPLAEQGVWRLTDGKREVSVEVRGPIESDHLRPLRNAAVAGLGITVSSARFIATDIAAGRLVRVLPRWRLGVGEIHLVYPSRRFKPAKLTVFADFLRAHPAMAGRDA